MATVPLSGTNIRFISGVPFAGDYKHTRWFDTLSQQTSYFTGKTIVHNMTQATFQRMEGQPYVNVNKSIDSLWGTNYMMFQNTHYNSKWFYCFVDKLEYVNKEMTKVHFSLDVFQTWKFDMNFKPSFVVREHQRQFAGGQPIINTVDEGLNYGTEYDTVSVSRLEPSYGFKWMVIVSKQMFHNDAEVDEGLHGTAGVIGAPQPLSYYIAPFKNDNTSADVDAGTSVTEVSTPTEILNEIRKNTLAVSNIVSIYVTDYTGIPFTYYPNGRDGLVRPQFELLRESTDVMSVADIGEAKMIHIKSCGSFSPLVFSMGDKYEGFYEVDEAKLMMYPYCVTILDDFKGNRIEVKNEHIISDDLVIRVKGSLGHSNKTSYAVKDFNYTAPTLEMEMSNEFALINSRPNDIPILNEMLAAFIQGNRNSVGNQIDAATFNGMAGLAGNTIGALSSIAGRSPAGLASSATNLIQGAGNTVLNLQGIMAKAEDLKNIPPSISKMGGHTIYESGNNYEGLYVIKKQIKSEYRKKITDFFRLYGYKTNEVKIPNFHTRKVWNYVQTEACMITGNFNNDDLLDLKAVFDNGITFWHTDDVGNYALLNEVL